MSVSGVGFYYSPRGFNTASAPYWKVKEDPVRVEGWLLKAPLATKTVRDLPQP